MGDDANIMFPQLCAFDLNEKVCATYFCDPLIWLWLIDVKDVCGRQLWSIVPLAPVLDLGKLVVFLAPEW